VSYEACLMPASCKNGICSDPPGDKEPCGVEGLCAMGTTCGVAGLCVKLPGLDQECFGECQAGLQCTGGESGPGKCIAQVCK
jgi:hypothetical protein